MKKKSIKPVKLLDEIVLPFTVIFPIAGQVSINTTFKEWKKGEEVTLTFPEYEALLVTPYAEYIS